MSQFLDKGFRFPSHPVRLMDDNGAYLSGPIYLYTETQKEELEAQGVDTSHFIEITPAVIEEPKT